MKGYEFTKRAIELCLELGIDSDQFFDYLDNVIHHPIIKTSFNRFITGSTEEIKYVDGHYV